MMQQPGLSIVMVSLMELLWGLVVAIVRGIAEAIGWGAGEHALDPGPHEDSETDTSGN